MTDETRPRRALPPASASPPEPVVEPASPPQARPSDSARGGAGRGARFAATGTSDETLAPRSPSADHRGGRFTPASPSERADPDRGRRFSDARTEPRTEKDSASAQGSAGGRRPGGSAELTPLIPPTPDGSQPDPPTTTASRADVPVVKPAKGDAPTTNVPRPAPATPPAAAGPVAAPWARPWPAVSPGSAPTTNDDTVQIDRVPAPTAPPSAPPAATDALDQETRRLPRFRGRSEPPRATRALAATPAKSAAPTPPPRQPVPSASTVLPAKPSDAKPPTEPKPPTGRKAFFTRKTLAIGGGVAAIVVALILTLILVPRGAPSASGSPTADAAQLDALAHTMLQPSELSTLAAANWAVASSTQTLGDDSPLPQCVDPTGFTTQAEAAREQVLQGGKDDPVVLQLAQTYADADTAGKAFDEVSAALGTCAPGPAFLQSGLAVSDLADEATGVVVDALDTTYVHHTIVASRTGENITILDVASSSSSPDPTKVTGVAKSALARLCEAGGTCPGTPKADPALVPPGSTKGWLEASDLPRVRNGSGVWAGTDSTITSATGTQCENVDLSTVAGPQNRDARSYVLAGDASAPATFGVDMLVFSMSDANAAGSFANTLRTNISKCADRTRTATVGKAVDVDGAGQGGAKIDGQSFEVTQATPDKVLYRVAVLNVGSRVVYVRATPSSSFDFSDGQWTAAALRAAQRASQA